VVFGEASRLRIQTTSHYHDDIFLTLDGESFLKIPDGECIEFKKSRLSVQMVNLKQRTFYEVVNEKLSERRA
ncbi:MAG TPA: NAD+ kinase, partial [Ruminococcaceae bacterium]|nr:NAD+ kinase [Oscillospiraceae bacterium]